jgi:hypothetical protein
MAPPGPLVPFVAFSAAYALGTRAIVLYDQSAPNRFILPVAVTAGATAASAVALVLVWLLFRHCFEPPPEPPVKTTISTAAAATAATTTTTTTIPATATIPAPRRSEQLQLAAKAVTGVARKGATEATRKRTTDPRRLWTIDNKRYDLSSFVRRHPGGSTAILLGRGRNCTVLFYSYHAVTRQGAFGVKRLLQRYYVEDAVEGDADHSAVGWQWSREGAPFYFEVVAKVRAYFGLPHGVLAEARVGSHNGNDEGVAQPPRQGGGGGKKEALQPRDQQTTGSSSSSCSSSSSSSDAGGGFIEPQAMTSTTTPPPSGSTISKSNQRLEPEDAPHPGRPMKASVWKLLYELSGCVATLACLAGVVLGDWLSVLLLPVAYWVGPSSLMHDGCHFSLSSVPWINRLASYAGSAHMSPTRCARRHVLLGGGGRGGGRWERRGSRWDVEACVVAWEGAELVLWRWMGNSREAVSRGTYSRAVRIRVRGVCFASPWWHAIW